MSTIKSEAAGSTNGAALAALLAAGIGGFAMGTLVLLHEAKVFVSPSLYAPAGGLSGRTTLAVAAWLVAWVVLHRRWKDRQIEPKRAFAMTLLLVALGLLEVFPPVWALLG